MKRILFFAALATGLFTSCSTAFKSGQTPDDLYYSPGTETRVAERDDRRSRAEADEYQEYVKSSDDRYLHMKVANRSRWSEIDNYSYWNDTRYDYNSYSYYNSFSTFNRWGLYDPFASIGIYGLYNYYGVNPYYGSLSYAGYGGYGGYGFNYGYGYNYYGWNPFYTIVAYNSPKFGGSTTATSGLGAYRNKYYNNVNSGYGSYRSINANGTQDGFGGLVRRVFTGSSSNNSSSFERPARSFSNSSPGIPATSSSAGGNSGGFKSTGTTTSTGRGGKN